MLLPARRGERISGKSLLSTVIGSSSGIKVRLRDDTPPLTLILEVDRDTSRRLAPTPTWTDTARGGAAGPEGNEGSIDRSPSACAGSPGAGAYFYGGAFFGGAWAPIGAVPPGLRAPTSDGRASAFAAPFHAAPGSDVAVHRPGLSTGSGIYAR